MITIIVYYSLILILISIIGFIVNRNNPIQTLISLEIVLLSLIVIISLNSYINSALLPLIGSFLLIVVAASESSLGLIIIVKYYKIRGSIKSKNLQLLKKRLLSNFICF